MACLLTRPAAVYRPRQPLESDLHRLVREHFDDLRTVYPERYARTHGHWRTVYDKAVRLFLRCGDLQHGFARVRCPDCRHEFLAAFSCKQRCICPSCSQKRTILFGLHVAEDVCLPAPHRQFVWTVPKRLRVFFRYHRKLLARLPALAWQTVREVYHALLGPMATPGAVLGIQTFGQLIHYHPHIHGLVTDGAFTPDGRFLNLPSNLTHEPFLRLWEQKVFDLLLAENRIEPAVVRQIRSWRHSGFGVDRSVRLAAGDREGIENLAQYMARSPFSLARLVRITPTGQVVYRAEKDKPQRFPDPGSPELFAGVKRNFQVFQPLDFLAELLQHIPDKGEHLTRYYGYYSNKARGLRAKRAADAGPPTDPAAHCEPTPREAAPPSTADRRRWAVLIKRIYHVDPLLCPRCGGRMKVIAFIEARQADVIRRILKHCGLWQDPAPRPPPRSPPPPGGKEGPPRPSSGRPWPLFPPPMTQRPPASESLAPGEVDPDFIEHLRYEDAPDPEPQPPWDF